jgi:rod shape-determining protein MreC
MYRKQVRRRRAVLVVLVVACLVLISTHFSEGEDGPLHSVSDGVGSVLGPIEDGASRALKPIRDLVNWFDETFEARGENEELRTERDELQEELLATQAELEEGLEKGRIVKITDKPELASLQPLEARVIARSPTTWDQVLGLDKGTDDGIEVNDPVVAAGGLVGRVSSASGGSSRVTLLTDQDSSVTAVVLGGGPTGIVGASVGDPDNLIFELIEGDKEVNSGARLMTAGIADANLPSIYPAGIPIGEAKDSSGVEQELRRQVRIDPYADLADLTIVSVLTGGGS